jgi:hypothetical protein
MIKHHRPTLTNLFATLADDKLDMAIAELNKPNPCFKRVWYLIDYVSQILKKV